MLIINTAQWFWGACAGMCVLGRVGVLNRPDVERWKGLRWTKSFHRPSCSRSRMSPLSWFPGRVRQTGSARSCRGHYARKKARRWSQHQFLSISPSASSRPPPESAPGRSSSERGRSGSVVHLHTDSSLKRDPAVRWTFCLPLSTVGTFSDALFPDACFEILHALVRE